MSLSSLLFVAFFLPLVLATYYLAPRSARNAVLLAFSLFFYVWASGAMIVVLLASLFANFSVGLAIARMAGARARGLAAVAIAGNLFLIGYFKYTNFFIEEVARWLPSAGIAPIGWGQVVMPLGISFFTFHNIGYIVDVCRDRSRQESSLVNFALSMAMFPKIIAGPIVRPAEISSQLVHREETLAQASAGALRFFWGLAKKVIVATHCGEVADAVFSMDMEGLDTKTAWLGAVAYTLQLYFDFSGYCDMAIGLGLMFGFRIPENFHRPYSAASVTDFWRRWHMTLSRFLRDYLYIPLGGNRLGTARTYVNLIAVFLLCGLWHGANWTFIAWGGYHGGLLVLERLCGWRSIEAESPPAWRRAVTFLLLVVGWVLFRSTDLVQAGSFIATMFWPVNGPISAELAVVLNGRNLFFLGLAAIVVFLPREVSGPRVLTAPKGVGGWAVTAVVMALLVLYSVILMVSNSFNPDLYAEF